MTIIFLLALAALLCIGAWRIVLALRHDTTQRAVRYGRTEKVKDAVRRLLTRRANARRAAKLATRRHL